MLHVNQRDWPNGYGPCCVIAATARVWAVQIPDEPVIGFLEGVRQVLVKAGESSSVVDEYVQAVWSQQHFSGCHVPVVQGMCRCA